MKCALEWIVEHGADYPRILICTDSQSLCKAILGSSSDTDELKLLLSDCVPEVAIQWIPGHSDIPGNDLADACAKEAAKLEGEGRGVSYRGIVLAVDAAICDPAIQHDRTRKVYSNYSKEREKTITCRHEKVTLARIRSGHHKGFRLYQHRLNPEIDPKCTRCDSGADDSMEHWLLCEALTNIRQKTFGNCEIKEDILTTEPRLSVVYWRRSSRDTVGDVQASDAS